MTLPFVFQINQAGTINGAGPFPLPGLPATFSLSDGTGTVAPPQIIPIQTVSAQQFNITLNNQACTIRILFRDMWTPDESEIQTNPPPFFLGTYGFIDLYVNAQPVVLGTRCMDRNLIVRDSYLGFVGDLTFIDLQGTEDPNPSGLGNRWILTYWSVLP